MARFGLARTESASGFTVTHETALGATTYYGVERPGGEAEVRSVTDPAGLVTTRARDRAFATTTTVPSGMRIAATPSADPRLGFAAAFTSRLALSSPGGRGFEQTTERSVEPAAGPVMSWTDTIRRSTLPAPTESTSEWDALARTQTLSTFEGRESVASFDVRGRLESSRIGTLHPTKLSYDTRGRIDAIAQGPGTADRTTTFTYHPTTGRLASITDPASRVTTFDLYDAAGRVLAMTLPGARTVGFTYDANGNLASLAPPGKPTHVFRYTPVDQENEYEPPAIAGIPDPRTLYTYDLDRKLDLVTRPDGRTVDLSYEAGTGRLDTITIAEGVYDHGYHATTDPVTGEAAGQIATITAPGGQNLAFSWDGELPLSSIWSGPVAGTVSRTFDDDFRIETETVDGTSAIAFGYDDDGLLTSAGNLSITRNGQGAGLVTATALGVVTTSETPNAFAELDADAASISGTPVYANGYTARDALGRINAKTETLQGATTNYGYTYTPAGQLDVVTIAGTPVRDYDYDANGNRTHVNGALVGTYDAQDRLTSYQGTTYTYTAAGDLETKTDATGTTTHAYDALGNLRTVVFPSGMRIEYVIDGQNRRVGKKVCAAPCTGGSTAHLQQGFLYADQLRIVAELDGSNQIVSRFVYGTKAHVPDFMVKSGVTYRMLSDHLGSVRLVVNAATGAIAQRIDYDEWGNVLADSSPGFQPFGFAGGLADLDTGLVRFGARDYDPRVGRWTSKDPIRFAGNDMALYGYVLGDPVNSIDPTGRQVWAPPLKWLGKQAAKRILGKELNSSLAECQGFDCDHDGLPDDGDGDGTPLAIDPDDGDPNIPLPTPFGFCRVPDLQAPFGRAN